MKQIAILGPGTVGGGVAEILMKNADTVAASAGEEIGLRMQYRGVYKEECSMKKVCASLFLVILLLAAIVPVSAAGTLR